jgi:thioredoxin reductase
VSAPPFPQIVVGVARADSARDAARQAMGLAVTLGGHVHLVTAFETSAPGVFAIGDVRAGSVKRVASAVGEGSVVVPHITAHVASAASRHGSRRAPADPVGDPR